jgi:hypothetical protein
MALIRKSHNSSWRVWSGPLSLRSKGTKRKVGVTIAVSIRADKLPSFSEDTFVSQASKLLIDLASKYDPPITL